VYIEEAHAADEWPICEAPRELTQHKSLDERLKAARLLLSDYEFDSRITFFADDMQNSFNCAYASWPFRFWVLMQGTVQLKAMPNNAQYDLNELDLWLHNYKAKGLLENAG